jgi:hypothetical protein
MASATNSAARGDDRASGGARRGLLDRANNRLAGGDDRLVARPIGGGVSQHRDREIVRPRFARAPQRDRPDQGLWLRGRVQRHVPRRSIP